MNVKDPGSRLLRWRILLAEYDYEIIYKKGSQNTNADALSRIGMVSQEADSEIQMDEDQKTNFARVPLGPNWWTYRDEQNIQGYHVPICVA
jgi:hypothetical protein